MLRDGKLISPQGWDAGHGEVLSVPPAADADRKLQAEKRQAVKMDEQPERGAIAAILV